MYLPSNKAECKKNCHKTDPFCLILYIFYTDFLFPIGFFPFVLLLALTLCFSRLCYSRILVYKPGAIVGVGDHERGVHAVPSKYRIYSINRPGRLLNFWTLRVGAYSRWALIRGWALIKFSPFSASVVCLFCNKTINGNNKTRRCNKASFL